MHKDIYVNSGFMEYIFSSIFCMRQSFKKGNKSSTPRDTQEKGEKDFIPPPEYTSVGKVKCLWVK